MKKLKYLLILAVICLLFVPCGTFEAHADSHSYVGMAVVSEGELLESKDCHKKLAMASTTKIFTALTVIENCKNLDELVKVPAEALRVEGTSIYLKADEKLTVKELLYGLMLRSGNDAAVTLAYHVSGGIKEFAELMNKTATKYGLENTSLKNPHGLDEKDHYTTAYDLAIFTQNALKNKTFREIVSAKNFEIKERENCPHRYFVNKNRLLNSLEGCIGVKTGYTSHAGRCLVSAINDGEKDIVCVVLNCRPMFEDSAELLTRAKIKYGKFDILKDYGVVDEVPVEDGSKNYVRIYYKKGFSKVMPKEEISNITVETDFPKSLKAPLKKDQEIGTIKVFDKNNLIFEQKLYIMEEVKSKSISDKIKNIFEKW